MSPRILDPQHACGVFGKLPAYGDFLRLNLSADVAGLLEEWLDTGLGQLETDDPSWRDAFVLAPVWRFVIECGPADSSLFAGVLMPSRDAAGRLFPCIVLAGCQLDLMAIVGSTTWFDRLEAAVGGAVNGVHDSHALVAELGKVGPLVEEDAPLVVKMRSTAEGLFIDALSQSDGRSETLQAVLATAAISPGSSLWWRHALGRTRIIAAPGLPRGQAFAAMFRSAEREISAPTTSSRLETAAT